MYAVVDQGLIQEKAVESIFRNGQVEIIVRNL